MGRSLFGRVPAMLLCRDGAPVIADRKPERKKRPAPGESFEGLGGWRHALSETHNHRAIVMSTPILQQKRLLFKYPVEIALWQQAHRPFRLRVPFATGATHPRLHSARAWLQSGPRLLPWIGFRGNTPPYPIPTETYTQSLFPQICALQRVMLYLMCCGERKPAIAVENLRRVEYRYAQILVAGHPGDIDTHMAARQAFCLWRVFLLAQGPGVTQKLGDPLHACSPSVARTNVYTPNKRKAYMNDLEAVADPLVDLLLRSIAGNRNQRSDT